MFHITIYCEFNILNTFETSFRAGGPGLLSGTLTFWLKVPTFKAFKTPLRSRPPDVLNDLTLFVHVACLDQSECDLDTLSCINHVALS